ncbi:hypothetical protein, partial [Escherichia coli]|uniref:hypothetical protein n=1 Tax=Escherichia coli TaxID=562 RepID=UPI0019653CF1
CRKCRVRLHLQDAFSRGAARQSMPRINSRSAAAAVPVTSMAATRRETPDANSTMRMKPYSPPPLFYGKS